MKEERADILSPRVLSQADAVCVTTNGIVKSNGRAVMGAGVAKAFRDRYPLLDITLGMLIKENGSITRIIGEDERFNTQIVALPTKYDWRKPSSISLIKHSLVCLSTMATELGWNNVWLTRPGCGHGGLKWTDIKHTVAAILDDRFTVCWLPDWSSIQ